MKDFETQFSEIENHFAHLCVLLNKLSPSKAARVVSSGARAQWDFNGRSHTAVDLDTLHHKGKLYIRVRVSGHLDHFSTIEAQEFTAFYAKTVAVASQCEQYLTQHGASETAVVGAPTL